MKFLPGLGDRTEPARRPPSSTTGERGCDSGASVLWVTQSLLQGETMDNVDADLLAAFYNP